MIKTFNLFLEILTLCCAFTIAGCATPISKKMSPPSEKISQQWETKILITNLKDKKSQTLDIDIFSVQYEAARFEVTALLGTPVASLVSTPNEFSYINYSEKKVYNGTDSNLIFEKTLGLPLNIFDMLNIAFEQPFQGKDWKCTNEKSGEISECKNQQQDLTIQWKDRESGKKNVSILTPQIEILWHFKSPKTHVQFQSDIFTLTRPNGFKAIKIN
jgi:hypothetical protein